VKPGRKRKLVDDRRGLVWINVTANPTAEWVARQITAAFPRDGDPSYMIRDRSRIYGAVVTRRLRAMDIRDKPIAPERLIGSIRRECLDHLIVLGEAHLRRILKNYADYYNGVRTHRSLKQRCAGLTPGSAIRLHKFRRPVGRTSSPLRSGLSFRHTQVTDDIRIVNEMRKDRARVVGVPGISSAIFKQ
jgi:hypothetical protein